LALGGFLMENEIINRLYELLEQKEKLFLEYEKESLALLDCDIDDMEEHINNRGKLSVEIDENEEQIKNISNNYEYGFIKPVLSNSCDRNQLSLAHIKIFDKSQKIFSIVNRISRINCEIEQRIILEQEALLEEIKLINSGQEAKASKYSDTVSDGSKPYIPVKIKSI
jgi:hypothetical protein